MTSCLMLLFLATKLRCVSKISGDVSAKRYIVSAKNWQISEKKDSWVSKNLLSQQKSADSAKKYAVSAKTYWISKTPWWRISIYDVSATMCRYLDRRRTLTRRRPTVYRVWTLSGIWFLSAAAARTLPLCLHHRFNAVLNSWVHI